MKRYRLLLAAFSIVLASLLASCTTGVFAEDTDPNALTGKWFYGTDEDNGTLIDLKENGEYYYEERSFGRREKSASGRWSVKGRSLRLWNLLEQTENPEGFEQFVFSLSLDEEGRDQLKLTLTLMRSATYTRIGTYENTVSIKAAAEEETPEAELSPLDGIWLSDDGFTAVVSGNLLTIIKDGKAVNESIQNRSATSFTLSENRKSYIYVLKDDAMTVISETDPSLVITMRRNQR